MSRNNWTLSLAATFERFARSSMDEEKFQIDSPNNDPRQKRIQTLEARKKDLLQRKSLVRDSFVSKHIDWLLLEVDDLLTKYDQPKINKEDTK